MQPINTFSAGLGLCVVTAALLEKGVREKSVPDLSGEVGAVPWPCPQSGNIPSPPVPSHARSPTTSHTILYGMFTHFLKLSQSARPAKPGAAKWRKKKRREKVLNCGASEPTQKHRDHRDTGPGCHPAGRVFGPPVCLASGPSLGEGQHPVRTAEGLCPGQSNSHGPGAGSPQQQGHHPTHQGQRAGGLCC